MAEIGEVRITGQFDRATGEGTWITESCAPDDPRAETWVVTYFAPDPPRDPEPAWRRYGMYDARAHAEAAAMRLSALLHP